MPIWLTAPVDAAPRTDLVGWMLIRTELNEVHAVGYNAHGSEGRVSSPLLDFDVTQRTATTRSGRTYVLQGSPGTGLDAEYVFRAWLRVNRVSSWTEVTDQVLAGGLDCVVDGTGTTETP